MKEKNDFFGNVCDIATGLGRKVNHVNKREENDLLLSVFLFCHDARLDRL